MPPHKPALALLLSLGIDYIRWTQLAPMFLMWGFGLLILLALTFVNFQAQMVPALASFLEWLAQLPVIGPQVVPLLSGKPAPAVHKSKVVLRNQVPDGNLQLSDLMVARGGFEPPTPAL